MSEQSNATALVTGANRGIGREVARQLAERGYHVLLTARDGEQASGAAQRIADSTGANITALTLDVADPRSIAAAAESVSADPGTLDVLVNNAGVGSDFGVSGTAPDFDAIERALQTNFYGAYRLTIAPCRCCARAFIHES
jgi:NAD(P)-dependent dehydrogenase (short-subunit alcohol dehydrogenase family)